MPGRQAGASLFALLILAVVVPAAAQTWTAVSNPFNIQASHHVLLTDGTVLVQEYLTGNWFRLAPDANGNYADGSWTQVASLPSGYAPDAYASAVLPDGRLIIEGGEYNGSTTVVETNLGAIYDPVANTWTSVNPPTQPALWTNIGDAVSVVLPNGTFMMSGSGSPGNRDQAFLDAQTLTWTVSTAEKPDGDFGSEEGWVLLPGGKVLTVELSAVPGTLSDLFDPNSETWSASGAIPVQLGNPCGMPAGYAAGMGPMVLRPDGKVLAIGGTTSTAIYDPASGAWAAGLTINPEIDADGPGVSLPDGNVFLQASWALGGPNGACYNPPSIFLEYDGSSQFIEEPPPPNGDNDASYQGEMLLLPTGQVLFTDEGTDIEIYTHAGNYQASWQPTITSVSTTLEPGSVDNQISGTQFNGLSQSSMYGDDWQMATNFLLVRITNDASGHVFYCRTHSFSTMGVATGAAPVTAQFDVPAGIEAGPSQLVVVANGIPSTPVAVTVAAPFSISVTPGSQQVYQYNDAYFTVNVSSGGTVDLSSSCGTVNCSISPTTISGTGSATLDAESDHYGSYTLTVTDTMNGTKESAHATLIVNRLPQSPQALPRGGAR